MYNFDIIKYLKTNPLVLAPMAGYSDIGFRHLCRKYGAGLVFTEMVSVKAILHDNEKTKLLMETIEDEHPIALQLFGSDPEDFKKVLALPIIKNFDMIDINMGCPAPKVVKNGEGSALLENLPLAEEIIKTCVEYSPLPVSVKFRSGVDGDHIIAEEFAKMCEKCGVSMITLHPRTREQGYAGHADWEIIKRVAKTVKIPVVASGDVLTNFDLHYLINECGASGVMIGRGSIGRPEIFTEIKTGNNLNLKIQDKIEQFEEHSKYLLVSNNYNVVSLEMKKHILNYVKCFDNSTKLKINLAKLNTLDEMLELLRNTK